MVSFDFGTDSKRVLKAIGRAFALIEFSPDGKVITANENFCKILGYELAEIKGRPHSMFVEASYAAKPEYREFWSRLGRGEFNAGEFKRIGKGAKEIWIQASYNPVLNGSGKVLKVVKVAMDVTASKMQALQDKGKIDAISRAQAMIEFSPDGTVLTANDNFLAVLGYRLDEIQGRRHMMFVDPAYAQSEAYREFWSKLNRGEYVAEEFKRIGKGGREVWIQASYNPIFDTERRVIRVVKFATDVTARVESLAKIGAGLARLSDGDLQQRFSTPFFDALEPFRADFNAALGALDQSMLAVDANTHAIQGGAREISSAAEDLSQRTQQQASSLEETAAALTEITTTVRNTAESAVHARDVVGEAKEDAEKTGAVVREAVEAMGAIDNSSKQISQIIGVIDEIAFQTNLLALNAGVEAARAGDAGRGFAVVASEVRALAQRSAEAAKEIKALIRTSEERVGQGAALVARTGEALQRIVSRVLEIAQIVGGISAGVQEQSTALEEVNKAIGEMDGVTQANAGMVEETTAAVHNLSQQAEELAGLVGKYKITGGAEVGLRQELKRVAPHAFREAPKAIGREAPKAIGKASKPRAKVAAVANETWQEF